MLVEGDSEAQNKSVKCVDGGGWTFEENVE